MEAVAIASSEIHSVGGSTPDEASSYLRLLADQVEAGNVLGVKFEWKTGESWKATFIAKFPTKYLMGEFSTEKG
jgi:hypothetical protein